MHFFIVILIVWVIYINVISCSFSFFFCGSVRCIYPCAAHLAVGTTLLTHCICDCTYFLIPSVTPVNCLLTVIRPALSTSQIVWGTLSLSEYITILIHSVLFVFYCGFLWYPFLWLLCGFCCISISEKRPQNSHFVIITKWVNISSWSD